MAGNVNNPWRLVAPTGELFDGILFSTAWGATTAPTITYAFTDNQNQYPYADLDGWHPAMWLFTLNIRWMVVPLVEHNARMPV